MSYEEIEVTLVLCSESPGLLVDEIAKLYAVGEYRLRARPELAIHDVYLDLPDGALRAQRLGVRLRLVDGCQLITFKGSSKGISGGGKRREEIELDWSEDAWAIVAARLADHGIRPDTPGDSGAIADPLAFLSQTGFVVDQVRDTLRRPRDVILNEGPTLVLAELAVDSVVFQSPSGPIRHHEVEIEVKGEGGVVAMHDVGGELLERWPTRLRLWGHGKRSTGKAAAALIGEKGSTGFLNASGDLTPEAYDVIASRLG